LPSRSCTVTLADLPVEQSAVKGGLALGIAGHDLPMHDRSRPVAAHAAPPVPLALEACPVTAMQAGLERTSEQPATPRLDGRAYRIQGHGRTD
jgi:hypothetical protein